MEQNEWIACLREITASWGIDFPDRVLVSVYEHARMVETWNRKRSNLSGAQLMDEYISHAAHALAPMAVKDLACSAGTRVLDVGSGAGYPGIPLALANRQWDVTFLEAVKQKRVFLRTAVEALGLGKQVNILAGRAEELAQNPMWRENFDVVLGRAVAKLPSFLELCLPFARVGGLAISFLGEKSVDNLPYSAMKELGGVLRTIYKYNIKNNSICYTLLLVDKLGKTPKKYPRRVGIPKKRPL